MKLWQRKKKFLKDSVLFLRNKYLWACFFPKTTEAYMRLYWNNKAKPALCGAYYTALSFEDFYRFATYDLLLKNGYVKGDK